MSPRWRWWAIRAIGAFAAVLVLNALNVPTLIPYLTALLLVAGDGIRTARTPRVHR
jgi:hypothetical protein